MAKILLVEDEEFLLDLYFELLKGEGYEVDKAVTGEEALRFMREGGYDLVLLDLVLPKMGGVEVLEELEKSKPKEENKRIVFMTNLAKEAILRDGKRFHVEGKIIKSDVNPEEFLNQVKQYLD